MMEILVLALGSFASVFALGFQSRNINNGDYLWAAGTSFFIGFSQVAVWTRITKPDAGFLETLIFSVSGMCGVLTSMYVHKRFIKRKE